MSTDFTRRGAGPDPRDAADTRTRERRFTRGGDAEEDGSGAPLLADPDGREMLADARVRDRVRAGGPAPGGGRRPFVQGVSGLNALAGLWLIIAPFVLGYGGADPYWNDIVFGAIVAVLALARFAGAYRASALSWLNALIGVWIFVSAFWLDDTGAAQVNDLILGAIVFLLAIASATATDEDPAPRRRGLRA